MRRPIVVANWKMHTHSADAGILATSVRNNVADFEGVSIIICPPMIWLTEVASIIGKGGRLEVGAQNAFFEAEGAYTGEVSPTMIKDVANYVIVGHSERREYFGETDLDVNEKTIAALKAGLTPIICVGERKKKNNPDEPVSELIEALAHIPKKNYKDIIVAYEPVWAIGTGENADPIYVSKIITKLREIVHSNTSILYGGSVNSGNAESYAKMPQVDGLLVGGASLRAADFVKICRTWSLSKNFKNDLFVIKEEDEDSN
ncbi:MAG: triose-phosphate isomerase [Patescibacteria group bacterium]